MKNQIESVMAHIPTSTNEYKILMYSFFIYLNVNIEAITILSLLMLIDTIFGAVKVLRIDYKKFRFQKLLIGFSAKVIFLLLPLVVALIGKGLGYNLNLLVDITIKILIVSEGISIFSNAIAIKTKKEVEDYDIITRFLKYVRSLFIRFAEVIITKKNENEDD